MDKNVPSTATPATPTAEELCGSANILDTVHLKNLVDDLSKLYSRLSGEILQL